MKAFVLGLATSLPTTWPDSNFGHAHCGLMVHINQSCDKVYSSIIDFVDNNKDPASPQGTYRHFSREENKSVWTVRETANKKYQDDVVFELSGNDKACNVNAHSRSQSFSLLDNGVNFCNMYNVVRTIDTTITDKSNLSVGDCGGSFIGTNEPSDVKTCDRY